MPLERYLQRASEAGIARTILFSPFHSDYQTANRKVAGIIARDPVRFYGFAFVHAFRDRGRIHRMVKETVVEYGFCGIKVHRRDAVITREVCETARALSLPVLYDIMGEVAIIPTLASEYPDVTFIIPHLGTFNDDSRVQRMFIELLSRYPNIITDTSGVRFFDQLKAAVYQAGPHKILFGTDGPWLHPEVEMEKIYALKLSRSDEDNVLGGNIMRLIAGSHPRHPARIQR